METVKEKLVKLIENGKPCPDGNPFDEEACLKCRYKNDKHCNMTRLVDYLVQNGVTIQEWVSVDERLPEKQHDWVLAACKLVPEGYYGVPHIAELRNGKWWSDDGKFPLIEIGVKVTHWMPLPAPPKEVE